MTGPVVVRPAAWATYFIDASGKRYRIQLWSTSAFAPADPAPLPGVLAVAARGR
jgi:hypothetical protein